VTGVRFDDREDDQLRRALLQFAVSIRRSIAVITTYVIAIRIFAAIVGWPRVNIDDFRLTYGGALRWILSANCGHRDPAMNDPVAAARLEKPVSDRGTVGGLIQFTIFAAQSRL